MKFKFTLAQFFQYYLPATLTLFMLVSIERVVYNEGGGADRMYGLPLAYITGNVGCTGCYLVYYGALIVDMLTYFAFLLFLFTGIK